MASSAIKAELTVVNIVGAMAVVAAATQVALRVERLAMTGLAVCVDVRTIESKFGLTAVIETPPGPVDR